MAAPRILLHVQHLLGIGHLARASHIAQALQRRGLGPVMVTGGLPVPGFPPPGIAHVELPPLRAAEGFASLIAADGAAATPAFLAARRDRLVGFLHSAAPQLIVIEAFPFGRRQMRFELLALLEAARAMTPRPMVAVSVRDIVQPSSKTGRVAEVLRTLDLYFDHVLVHGDPQLARLSDSFPAEPRIRPPVSYTGLVTGGAVAAAGDQFDVIVSAGGGAAQGRLPAMALAARAQSPLAEARWLFVTGPNAPDGLINSLRSALRPAIWQCRSAAIFRAFSPRRACRSRRRATTPAAIFCGRAAHRCSCPLPQGASVSRRCAPRDWPNVGLLW